MDFPLVRTGSTRRRLVARRSAGRSARSVLFAAAALGTACASEPAAPPEPLPPLRVRVGAIAPREVDAATVAPGSVTDGIEQLVDLFWQRGCRGGDLTRARARDTVYPDVVCRLPGRTPETVVVAAYVDPRSDRGEDWTGPALLPYLYSALSVESREHSFVFAGFARRSRGGVREDAKRLEETRLDRVRAIVDLRRLRGGSSAIGFAASDPRLRRDLSAVGRSLSRSGESLRLLALPDPKGSFVQRSRVATIRVASLDPKRSAGTESSVIAVDTREAFRSAARTLAVFLGYLDGTLRLRDEPPAPEATGR